MDDLRAVSAEVQRDIDAVLAPIDEVDAMLQDLESLSQRTGLDGSSLTVACIAAAKGEPVLLADGQPVDAAVQGELEALGMRLGGLLAKLEAVPAQVEKLANTLAQALVKVPRLAIEARAEAQMVVNNPFADDNDKKSAQADLQAAGQIQNAIMAKIQEAQAKVAALPQRAAQATERMVAMLGPDASQLAALATSSGQSGRVAVVGVNVQSSVDFGHAPVGVTATAGPTGTSAASQWREGTYARAGPSERPALERLHELREGVLRDLTALQTPLGDAEALIADLEAEPNELHAQLQDLRRSARASWFRAAIVTEIQGAQYLLPDGSNPDDLTRAVLEEFAARVLEVLQQLHAASATVATFIDRVGEVMVQTGPLWAEAESEARNAVIDPNVPHEAKMHAAEQMRQLAKARVDLLIEMDDARVAAFTLAANAGAKARQIADALPLEGFDVIAFAAGLRSQSAKRAQPTAQEVSDALQAVAWMVRECAKGSRGLAKASVTVDGETGSVVHASVQFDRAFLDALRPRAGVTRESLVDYYSTCMSGAIAKARFPTFDRPKFEVMYPFDLSAEATAQR